MSAPSFHRIAVLGLGLLGGSVALAAKRAGVASCVVGSGRRPEPLRRALANGVVDEVADVATAVSGADLVVLGMPVGSMKRVLEEAAPHMAEGTLVTDVGSVKGLLADTLPGVLPSDVHYVGAHPMAGSHEKGVGHASADLFDGACCIITAQPDTNAVALQRISDFWRALGARVVERDPSQHDAEVAWVSHVPHALAFAFAHALAQAPEGAGEVAGSGFRDFTRIAHSDVALWTEILHENRKALVGPLEAVARSLQTLARSIEDGDAESQEKFLSLAHETLSSVAAQAVARGRGADEEDARSGGANPEIQAGPEGPATPRSVENDS
jgi:cyclohexadieny/prephenate dehydrogenase